MNQERTHFILLIENYSWPLSYCIVTKIRLTEGRANFSKYGSYYKHLDPDVILWILLNIYQTATKIVHEKLTIKLNKNPQHYISTANINIIIMHGI